MIMKRTKKFITRLRIRGKIWKQWKKIKKRYTSLRKLGISHRDAYVAVNLRI